MDSRPIARILFFRQFAKMSIIRSFRGITPTLGTQVFVADNAAIIGDVVIGDHSSVWFSTTIRGDVMPIRIGSSTSIQDNAVVHVTAGRFGTTIGSRVTVGHGAIIHACVIEDDCLIGMGSILLDGCRIGAGSLIGAGALVTPGTVVPPRSMVVGSPARVKRPLTDEETTWIGFSSHHYVELARAYIATA
jgi:gamma-carbonic anhydrase